jgi:stearoyl-CoA desaturase (delta-9 desaturase)
MPNPNPVAVDHDDIIHPKPIPFILAHLACLGALWTGVSWQMVLLATVLYVVRMFGVTAGYHRYFSHRTFKTSRVGQFLLAFLAQTSAQRGILWWAAKHRHHHRHSDTPEDIHSPRHFGFWYSHWGWIFTAENEKTQWDEVPDLSKYPELVWLEKNEYVPPFLLAVACFLFAGWEGLIVGFFWSTVVLYHGTFFINSLAHVHGNVRYVTGDDSRNNWWLAVITLGEGWHNNHHAYQRSTRQGFRWYEFDPTFYVLKALSWIGVTSDLGAPPREVVRNERPLGRAVIEKVARHLAANARLEEISAQAREMWAHHPKLEELRAAVAEGRRRAEEAIAELHLPHLPTAAELRARAEEMYAQSPSMDEIVERARQLILERVSGELFPVPATA